MPLDEEMFDDGTDLRPLNPVYVIPHESVLEMRDRFKATPW
jgi:hypothetical protein